MQPCEHKMTNFPGRRVYAFVLAVIESLMDSNELRVKMCIPIKVWLSLIQKTLKISFVATDA